MTDTIDVAALVKRLRDLVDNDDHGRLCQGREYSCTCGYDRRKDTAIAEAATSLATMREALEAHEKLLLVNKVRHVAEEVAPLWLQNADRLTARALGGSNAE